jgi:hypothetical protein
MNKYKLRMNNLFIQRDIRRGGRCLSHLTYHALRLKLSVVSD